MDLRIYHNRTFVGYLRSAEGGISFIYDSAYLAEPNSFPLSLSLPLQKQPQPIRQTERFFEGLLPEGEERRRVARYLRVSSSSLLKLLAALAGDCVGNLTVLAPADDIDCLYEACAYEPLSAQDFEDIISNDANLITKITADNRLSIPGAQTKIGLYSGGEPTNSADQIWYVPKGLSASSHIIKPDSKLYRHTSLNEYMCSRLAVLSGIQTAELQLINHKGDAVLISKRFDREQGVDGVLQRLCQEDFCQALSISPNNKYQGDGGPSFAQILEIVRFETTLTDVQRFIRLFLFNYLIGNCDAHGKNYSLQRTLDGALRLAPAYDLISTTFYPSLRNCI